MIKDTIKADLRNALLSKDAAKTVAIKQLSAALTTLEKSKNIGSEIAESEYLAAIKGLIKKGKESIELFTKGGRQDLVDKEQAQIDLYEQYLPAQMSEDELNKIITEEIQKMQEGPERIDAKQIGRLTGAVMKRTAGNADGKTVQALIRSRLA